MTLRSSAAPLDRYEYQLPLVCLLVCRPFPTPPRRAPPPVRGRRPGCQGRPGPRPRGKYSRSIGIRLQRPTRLVPRDSPFPTGVVAGVLREAREEAEDETLVCTLIRSLNHAVDNFRASERENRLHLNPVEPDHLRSWMRTTDNASSTRSGEAQASSLRSGPFGSKRCGLAPDDEDHERGEDGQYSRSQERRRVVSQGDADHTSQV